MASERVNQRLEKLEQREEIIFSLRDKIEKQINKIIGKKLNHTQFLLLRTQFKEFERCEDSLQNVQEQMAELTFAV